MYCVQCVGCGQWYNAQHSGPSLRGCAPSEVLQQDNGHLLKGKILNSYNYRLISQFLVAD